LLPTQLLEKATHDVLKKKPIAYPAMCYGPDSGDPRLRKNVAQWLTKFYKPADAVSEDRICISGGASQNLACLLQDYTDPVYTRNVWIVAPAYMLAFRIFEDAGFHKKLRAVPEDDEGIDMGYLRDQIRKSEDKAKSENNNEPVSDVAHIDESVALLCINHDVASVIWSTRTYSMEIVPFSNPH
jgi:DNA-binding transcriptional MocR family regulator